MTNRSALQDQIYDVIFGYESRSGKLFDVALIILIMISVAAVLLDSMNGLHQRYGELLSQMEWWFTLLFTIEYLARLYSARDRLAYVTSFYGVVDLLSILPSYIAFLFPDAIFLIVVRILRVLRIFRILKLFRYMGEANLLFSALLQARRKIFVFLFSVITLIVIFGALMFVIEGPENGFDSIPRSIYWAIVTITTVGYGDIAPQSPLGQFIAGVAMICGYAIIAVPTGIIGAELMQEVQRRGTVPQSDTKHCVNCNSKGHDMDARYCKYCGKRVVQE
jgi:voltage-gated potassium channel